MVRFRAFGGKESEILSTVLLRIWLVVWLSFCRAEGILLSAIMLQTVLKIIQTPTHERLSDPNRKTPRS